jgi:hypothetical protein
MSWSDWVERGALDLREHYEWVALSRGTADYVGSDFWLFGRRGTDPVVTGA